ncbi:Cytochrome P450 94A1 [Ananas comosus]|uniref:Cytochrome P450 94A1 n=1 Tax=Ananas comosus TaxID=4615 RepID=A0A199VW99_ANACO|nr:Cytochrome P450 94A1 [Ananas comosus]
MELFTLQLLVLLFLLPFFLYIIFFRQDQSRKPTAYGLKPYPILGYLPQFIKNRHRFLEWTTEILLASPKRTMVFRSLGQASGVITANPANVEHMLKINFKNYPKGERSLALFEDFFGRGIFNSDGEHWKQQRKVASHEFNTKSLRNFVVDAVQFEIQHRLLPLLNKAEEREEIVEMQDVLERFGFDNICKVAFDADPASLTEEGFAGTSSDFMRAFGETQYLIGWRLLDALNVTWRIKKLLNIGSEQRIKEGISIVHNYALDIIRSRKERPLDRKSDLLSRFASYEDHSEELLRDNVINFLVAGRETTSSALTWFFWIVSTRPDVEKKIVEEIRTVREMNSNSSEMFSFDELREMHYLHAAISETMRLYPPVPIDRQSCKKDDTLPDGTFVGKGWFVTYNAYAMGRSKDIWGENCEEYKPERWLENGVFRPENPFRYPVFHAGPRMCLGKEMAYIQMKSIAACMLERFQLSVVGKKSAPEHEFSLSLKMKGGLPTQIGKREEKY